MAVHGKVIIDRTGWAWQSQQVEEPCILPNPKDPGRLIMFYSGVSAANRAVAAIGKAWAQVTDPWTWHQDAENPFFNPGRTGWDSGTIRLDAVLYLPEEDAYYLYYSGTTGTIHDHIGLAICPAGADGYSAVTGQAVRRWLDRPLLALDPEGDPLDPSELDPRAVLAFGTERYGLSRELTAKADARISIPMRPGVSSLNLATSVAAVLFAWRLSPHSVSPLP